MQNSSDSRRCIYYILHGYCVTQWWLFYPKIRLRRQRQRATSVCLRCVIFRSNNNGLLCTQPKVSYTLPERYVSLAVSSLKPKYPGRPPLQRLTHKWNITAYTRLVSVFSYKIIFRRIPGKTRHLIAHTYGTRANAAVAMTTS
jgi:hypothetical protein